MAEFAPEYRTEFDRELSAMWRRRFFWLTISWLGVIVLFYLFPILFDKVTGGRLNMDPPFEKWKTPSVLVSEFVRIIVLVMALYRVQTCCTKRDEILRIAFWTFVITGMCTILGAVGVHRHELLNPIETNTNVVLGGSFQKVYALSNSFMSVALAHFFACLFLPWRPKQAMAPLAVLFPIWSVMTLWFEGFSLAFIAVGMFGAPFIIALGVLICWWRQSRLERKVEVRAMRRQYRHVRQELFDARKIHERRFPDPLTDGPLRLSYSYEPMRQIGGDFLHTHVDSAGALHGVLVDVTGHGIVAALTVNRIDGELQRLLAENEKTLPDEILSLLNRYIHLTMARHSIYATVFVFRLQPDGTLDWANGGHPPAYIRRADGSVKSLDSTTFMLGVCPSKVFDPDPQHDRLEPGEVLVIYTDGACEARDERGKQFGLNGITRTLASWRSGVGPDLIPFLPETIRHFREGPADDDVLIVTVSHVA